MLDVAIKGQRGGFALDLAFTADTGVTALFGKSGAGKTSILRAIAGLWSPDDGHIVLNGRKLFGKGVGSVPSHERGVAVVFQGPLLFPHLNVTRNLLYAVPGGSQQFSEVVELLDLSDILQRMPRNLSGGEAQRVALGRALLSNPQLLLLDEPLTGLDAERRNNVMPHLERLCEKSKIPILYVSHNRDEVIRLAQRVLMVDKGRIVADMDIDTFSVQEK